MVHPFSPSQASHQLPPKVISSRLTPRFGQDSHQDAYAPSFLKIQPQQAINFNFETTRQHLARRLGQTQLHHILEQGQNVQSPVKGQPNGNWLKRAKIIEVNQRILGSYWNLVKYALTFPEDTILLKPVFKTGGTEQSLYSQASWKLNNEFRDPELTAKGYQTTAQQLKLTINLLHAMGKKVGMDIASHTDRFAETVFAYPDFFEWLEISTDKKSITDYTPEDKVKEQIQTFLREKGDADGKAIPEPKIQAIFDDSTREELRLNLLFGLEDGPKRTQRRLELLNYLHDRGLETVPLVYEFPYRPVELAEPYGSKWAAYKVPGTKSNGLFGVLTPYKQYHLHKDGTPDLSRPNIALWDYMARHTKKLQQEFGFDFLRADVGHLQINQYQVETPNIENNFWRHIKNEVRKNVPYFATFQENFYMPGFIDPAKDADIKDFDVALGNIQELFVADPNFLLEIKKRLTRKTNHHASVTLNTMDTDQIRQYRLLLSEPDLLAKAFLGLFLDSPSYMAMGLETRKGLPPQPDNPEDYRRFTHSYITRRAAPYQWGDNQAFFSQLTALREQWDRLRPILAKGTSQWLTAGQDAAQDIAAWFYPAAVKQPGFLFALNTNLAKAHSDIQLELPPTEKTTNLDGVFSTANKSLKHSAILQGKKICITNLAPGEGRIYRLSKQEAGVRKGILSAIRSFLENIFQSVASMLRRLFHRSNTN